MEYMSKFRDHHVKTVFYLALLGMTVEQMATVFEISVNTFNYWMNKFETFREAVKKGREQADAQVVYSLYQAAMGYEHPAEQIFMGKEKVYDPNTGKLISEKPKIIRVPIVKKYPPNVKAAIKWLETRQPMQWTNKEGNVKQLNVKHEFDFSEMSMEDLRVLNKLAGTKYDNVEDAQIVTTAQKELAEQRFEIDEDGED